MPFAEPPPPRILIIAETPSLASALEELIRSSGDPVEQVQDAGAAVRRCAARDPPPLLLAASNTHHCESVLRWREGALGPCHLIVVGSRDPGLHSSNGLHIVPLPLVPREFLRLLEGLLADSDRDRPGPDGPTGPVAFPSLEPAYRR